MSDIEVKSIRSTVKVAGEDNYDEVKAEGLGLLDIMLNNRRMNFTHLYVLLPM